MATNFVRGTANPMTVAAPYGVVSGRIVVVGTNLFGVAEANASSGDNVALARGGTWVFAKANAVSTSAAAGASAYWDNANSIVGISATSNTRSSTLKPRSRAMVSSESRVTPCRNVVSRLRVRM